MRTCMCRSDYLQAPLHPRSLCQLKPHHVGYSALARFPDGACIVDREDEAGIDGVGLVERVRRFLEECDAPQGFVCLYDADGGFGVLEDGHVQFGISAEDVPQARACPPARARAFRACFMA